MSTLNALNLTSTSVSTSGSENIGAGWYVAYALTLVVYLTYVGLAVTFAREVYQYKESLVLTKRHTFPTVLVSVASGCCWLLLYIAPITYRLIGRNPEWLKVLFNVLVPIPQYLWVYCVLWRVYCSWWDIQINHQMQLFEWTQLIDDRTADMNWFLRNQSTLGDHKFLFRLGIGLIITTTILSELLSFLPLGNHPSNSVLIVFLFIFMIWVFLEITPWVVIVIIWCAIPSFEDLYFVKHVTLGGTGRNQTNILVHKPAAACIRIVDRVLAGTRGGGPEVCKEFK
ncbi:hypothetical protein RFI_33808 [Reticulomyxa filosa]|uniref:Uncharacterized protein n=1 Tax=Reticulomyxa filosa TaxID=46433 RepID=X6LPP3_RETFI|nr:hypothetical protein RFI_33808 [Reticulomyxa filosa]|eukprot:ETO03594.1 hypothetical protein RFI_33808 [Reticulomyxa filosa]